VTRVLVDGLALATPSATRGIGTYLRSVLEPMVGRDLAVDVLAPAGTPVPTGTGLVPSTRRAAERHSYYEQLLRLGRDIRRADPDVFHSPGTDPPLGVAVPWVQTLHDVIPLAYPGAGYRAERLRWRARGRLIRSADAVIADSSHTADDAARWLGLDPSRVSVVHLGVDPRFQPPAERGLARSPYLLFVSAYGPHKGYEEAFELISALAERGLPHRLKVVGTIARRTQALVRRQSSAVAHADRIDLLGVVAFDQLLELYQQAEAVVVTSRYEGFGLPAVEAMATGTPLVAFANSSLPEVVGAGGVLVPDGDVDAFAAAVATIAGDRRRWDELSAAGLARSAHFSWQRAADATAAVLRSVARQ
jgi:glycosyltransferase involved in cell wall biosynthesis